MRHRERLAKMTFFQPPKNYCYEVSSILMKTREELRSTQEETDNRVCLHAAHGAAVGYRAVDITSEGVNVYLLSL